MRVSTDRLAFPVVALCGAGLAGLALGMFGHIVQAILAACGHATP
jgi:hypothetical protein